MAQQQRQIAEESSQRVQTYLDALEKPMASQGEAAAQEWRQEAEAHLYSLIQANMELGSTYEEAVTAALKQFGNTATIGREVAQVTRQHKTYFGLTTTQHLQLHFLGLCQIPGPAYLALLGMLYDSETSPLVHQLSHWGAELLFVLLPFLWGWNSESLQSSLVPGDKNTEWLRSKHYHWIWPMAAVFTGFISGTVYATMFDLSLGSSTFWNIPVLVGTLLYPTMALLGVQLQRHSAAIRRTGMPAF